jgi:hypothetical protein
MPGVGLRAIIRQPVVVLHQRREQLAAAVEDDRFNGRLFDQARKIADELSEARVVFHGEF